MSTVNLSVNVGESKTITFHSGGTYNPEDIVFDVSANGSGYKPVQTAVSSPTASSTATAFIDTISQNTNGVITATKKNLPTASSTVAGITKVGASGGAAAYNHNHTTSIATSTGTNQITLAFGTKYAISAGGTSYVFTMPANPNTNTTYTIATGDAKGQIKVTPSSGDAYNVSVKGLGSAAYTESSAYATSGHKHSGVYKPVQTAVSDPTASTTTSTTFIDTISQNANGVITATKKTLPTASTTVAGITKVGASGGAAAYSHNHTGYATSSHTHDTLIKASTEDSRITLAFGKKYTISAGGTSYVFTMPANPNTNTTYTFATGDSNGQIKVTPSGGSAQNVSVKGLGSAAYTESSAYATSGHNHSGVYKPVQTAVSDPPTASTLTATAFIDTISQNKNGVITATKKTLPTASSTVAGITTVGADGGAAAYEHTHTGYATSSHAHATSIAATTGANQITLEFGTKYVIKAGGTSYVFAMPKNPNTDTTYTFATGDTKGQIKVTPSSGDAYNVNVSGLGSAAYTDSIDYATSGHTHGSITNAGAIANNTTIANGDHLVITDKSDSDKIKRASITFGISQSTYLRNDGKWGTPSISTPLATPLFNDGGGGNPGTVIPIASTENEVVYKGDKITYNTIPSLIFPNASSTMALPIFMDKSGHLFMLISNDFATELINTYGFSTTPSGGKS